MVTHDVTHINARRLCVDDMVKGGEANKCENCGLKGKVFDLNLNKHFGFDDVPIDIFSTKNVSQKIRARPTNVGSSTKLS